jgi:hypothetical protein
MLVNTIRLYIIHVSAIAAGILGSYYSGLDIMTALVYLLIIAWEARRAGSISFRNNIITACVWQAPGIFFAVLCISSFDPMGLYEYAIFILQFWFTPLLGLLSLAGINSYFDKPLYYYLLICLPFISVLYYLGAAGTSRR